MTTQHADPADEVMCVCSGTTRGEIVRLGEQGMDMQAISRRTGAVSGCGGCEWDIEALLRERAERKPGSPQG